MPVAGFRPTSRASYYALAVPTMITKSNVFLDPLIYFGMNQQVIITRPYDEPIQGFVTGLFVVVAEFLVV
jgi:hypothetical protein